EIERRHIRRVLQSTGGNRARAARILGVDPKTLYNKLKLYETAPGASSESVVCAGLGGAGLAAGGAGFGGGRRFGVCLAGCRSAFVFGTDGMSGTASSGRSSPGPAMGSTLPSPRRALDGLAGARSGGIVRVRLCSSPSP